MAPVVQIFFVLIFSVMASARTNVTYLPGYDGDLPFSLETGYVSVGVENASQLFYYFVESQRSPALDPVMLWLTGGPGCSTLSAFFYESGPLEFNYENYNGSLPTLHLNPNSWTQGINIIYLDAPVGTGFSYSTTQENYYINDTQSTLQIYQFLRKWFIDHPQYLTNQLYIGGDSYSGIIVPVVVQEIINGNDIGLEPQLNLKGYIVGNPKTDTFIDQNSRIPTAHRLTLISDEAYEAVKTSCGGDYVNIDFKNTDCVKNMSDIREMLFKVNIMNVLEPLCQTASPIQNRNERFLRDYIDDLRVQESNSTIPIRWCRNYNYVLSGVWANNKSVREALNVRQDTIRVWKRCNASLAYTSDILSSLNYHSNLTSSDIRVLVFSGDHDMSIPHVGTQTWINMLNLTMNEHWRSWFVDGQVSGYTKKFSNDDYTLTYATIKGAGHIAPEYKPIECFTMIDRFMAYFPL